MKYSVIIPIYNVEKYIKKCVQSVLEQTYSDFEILLVDDGSTDNCPAICDELAEKDERIKVIHKQNGGVSSARNEGILQAKGEYILFLDGDDWYDTKLLENCLPYTERKLKAFYFSYKSIYTNSEELITSKINYLNLSEENCRFNNLKKLILDNSHYICAAWTGCYNRSFILKNNLFFDNNYGLGEDALFNFILFLYLDEYVYADFIGYYYNRTNQNSACHIKRISFDTIVQMGYDSFNNLKNRNLSFALYHFDFLYYFIVKIGNMLVERFGNISDAKKSMSKFKATVHKDFHKKNMKKALKFFPKIIYNEFRPLNYIIEKCYKALDIYSFNENKTSFYLRCFFLKISFPFVRLNAKIKRRLKGLFKK